MHVERVVLVETAPSISVHHRNKDTTNNEAENEDGCANQ